MAVFVCIFLTEGLIYKSQIEQSKNTTVSLSCFFLKHVCELWHLHLLLYCLHSYHQFHLQNKPDAVRQQKVTDVMMKDSRNSEEAQNKDESQKDKLNKPKGIEAVTNEVTIRRSKRNVRGEKTNIDTLVSCDILCVVILFAII